MKRALLAAAVACLALPIAAQAKGPSEATVSGPGLDKALSFRGMGEPGSGGSLGTLAEGSGFFPALFGQTPDPMLAARPKGDLGPRYTITYRVPGPSGSESTIRQDLYPYARGGPVTYTAPGQSFFDGQRTRGGWFRGSPALKTVLVDAGLPRTPRSSSDGGSRLPDPTPATLALAAAVALALVAVSAAIVRRRPRAEPAR